MAHDISRYLLKEGSLEVATQGNKIQELYCFLFTDGLVAARLKKGTFSKRISYQVMFIIMQWDVKKIEVSGQSNE